MPCRLDRILRVKPIVANLLAGGKLKAPFFLCLQALELCGRFAQVAEAEGHHPDLHITVHYSQLACLHAQGIDP